MALKQKIFKLYIIWLLVLIFNISAIIALKKKTLLTYSKYIIIKIKITYKKIDK